VSARTLRVCFHGAESTGKSQLAAKLAREFGVPLVNEYGRTYAETIDTNFRLSDLTAIAARQNRMMREACEGSPPLVLLDTDPLMTAAWAEMLFGHAPSVLMGYDKAECYLLFEPDVPFVEDGTRFFGGEAERARFAALAEDMLLRAGVGEARGEGARGDQGGGGRQRTLKCHIEMRGRCRASDPGLHPRAGPARPRGGSGGGGERARDRAPGRFGRAARAHPGRL
jgi:nicotinamide riboside kinase